MYNERQITGIKIKGSSPDGEMPFVEFNEQVQVCELANMWNSPVFFEREPALENEPEKVVCFIFKEGVKYFCELPVEDEIDVKKEVNNEQLKKQKE